MKPYRTPLVPALCILVLGALMGSTGALAQTPPTFAIYPAPNGLGTNSGEPSIGVNWNSDRVMYIAGLETLRIDYDECTSPAEDTWTDVSPLNTTITTLDPILFTDSVTGRTFASQLAAKCSNMSYSDDDGDNWMISQGCGINAGVDHQTVGGGPYNHAALPPPPPPQPPDFYPHAVYYCSQDVAVAQCARSDNGGLTFGPAVPIYNIGDCGGLHGALHVDADGTVYVPNKNCGALPLMTGGRNAVAVSEDNGITWNVRQLPVPQGGNWDPSVWAATQPGSGANGTGVGTLYMGMIRTEPNLDRRLWAAVSNNNGLTWSNIQDIGLGAGPGGQDIRNAAFPVAVAGDGDRAAIGFLGAVQGGDGAGDNPSTPHVWYPYVAFTYDGGQTWETHNISADDPVQRGQVCDNGPNCNAARNLLDFNDMAVDAEGRVLFGYADGCLGGCLAGLPNSASELATVARQVSGRRLFAAFDVLDAPGSPRLSAVIDENDASLVHLAWQAPDDHGSAITGYDLFKRLEGGTTTALASLGPGASTFDDFIDPAGPKVFYSITASNAIGTSTVCREVSPTGDESPCIPPGLTVLEDGIGDWTLAGPDARDEYDIEKLSINERPDLGPGKIEFVLKMVSMANPLPSSTWPVTFQSNGARFVRMHIDATGSAFFTYGTGTDMNPSTNPGSPADPASGFSADGSIRIVVDRANVGAAIGAELNQFLVRVRREAVGVAPTPDNMPSSLTPGGSYSVFGSENCSFGDPPIAVDDSATTLEGAPVVIDVLANDISFNGALQVVAVTDPANGSAVDNGDGTVTYQPDPGFIGPPDDVFDYTIRDAAGLEDVGTVFVSVEERDPVPPHCELPGILVADDPLGDTNVIIDTTDDPSLDIDDVFLAEPDSGPGAEKLVATLTVEDFTLPHPSAAWRVFWTSPGGQQYFVSLENCDATAGLQCSYGTFDGTLFSSQGEPEGCEATADGTITITVDKGLVGIDDTSHAGSSLTDINGRTQVFFGALCTGLLGQADNAGPGTYEIQTNASCGNQPPVANDDTETTDENTAVTIDVLANDFDPDNDPIEVVNTSVPANGGVINNGTDVTYTPDNGFDGVDTFEYTITDNRGGTATAEVTVTVNDTVNNPPTADDQAVTTLEDTAVGITLTATDPEGQPLTYTVVSAPAHGTLTGTAPNLTYTPDPDYNGPDGFTFRANDGELDSNIATVSITVEPVNDAPFAQDDFYSTAEETTLVVAAPGVLANDTDPDGPGLTAALETPPANGVLALDPDGSFTYTPDAGFCDATDVFTYRAEDGDLSDGATVSIQVTCAGGNQPPTADDQSVTTDEDTAVAITLTASDPDNDPLSYAVTSAPAHGALSGTAPNLTYTPDPDYHGADSFTFEACDAEFCDGAVVSITVLPVNDPPVAADDAYATTEGTTLSVAAPGVLANDTDVDGNSLGSFLETGPANGTLALASDGSFTYTPDPGFCNATDSFTYRASDGAAQSAPATVTITVSCIVDPPVCDGDDDDFDSDGVRDDIDSDDDSDGISDEADSDDDNDGDSDDSDSDDDNDCIDDEFDGEGTHETVQFSPGLSVIDETVGSSIEVGPTTQLIIALAESAEAHLVELRIYDPSGGLVGVSAPAPGRALATAVPVAQGVYTVVVANINATGVVAVDLTTVERQLW